jgi:hypothetical protein
MSPFGAFPGKDKTMEAVQVSLLDHARPSLIAFQLYEMLNGAGYDDKEIAEVALALKYIVG